MNDPVWVYALRYEDGAHYVGLSGDLERRFVEHQRRQSISTRRLKGELAVIYKKPFPDYKSARSHEKFLKSGAGRELLKSIRT